MSNLLLHSPFFLVALTLSIFDVIHTRDHGRRCDGQSIVTIPIRELLHFLPPTEIDGLFVNRSVLCALREQTATYNTATYCTVYLPAYLPATSMSTKNKKHDDEREWHIGTPTASTANIRRGFSSRHPTPHHHIIHQHLHRPRRMCLCWGWLHQK